MEHPMGHGMLCFHYVGAQTKVTNGIQLFVQFGLKFKYIEMAYNIKVFPNK